MKFLIDNQLPISLVEFLRTKGCECKHVIELALDTATDHAIWDFAANDNWIVVSKDADFLHIAKSKPKSARLIWIRIGNCRTTSLLSAFERLWTTIESALLAEEDIIEIR